MTPSFTDLYRFNAVRRVHLASSGPGTDNESLPDPSSQEGRVLAVLYAATDLSHGSEDLLGFISDDFTRLHFSPERSNFLQPFRELLHGRVLVVGLSMGPIGRFVAEQGAEVHLVEPDSAHAIIAAARCRDLNNVFSYVGDDSSALADLGLFDLIIVTESGKHSGSVQNSLVRLRNALAPNGVLILAVNNSLGMSSIAGDGVLSGESWSLASLQVDEAFTAVGFQDIRTHYAFPTPRCCRLIIGPDVELPGGLEAILSAYDGCGRSANAVFGQQKLWKSILQNGLLKQFSNSLVIATSLQSLPKMKSVAEIGIYSSCRRRHFAKVTSIYSENEHLIVSRHPLFPTAPPPAESLFRLRAYDEPYFAGMPYLQGLREILEREGWQPEDIVAWARPWLDLLDAKATNSTFQNYIGGITNLSVLPPIYVDCIPNNIQVAKSGDLLPIDFEYEAVAPIPLHFVIYRGLHYALAAVTSTAPPEPAYANISELSLEVMRLAGIPLGPVEVQNYNRLEAALQNSVAAASISQTEAGLRSAMMRTRGIDVPSPSPATTADVLQVFWKTSDSQYNESESFAAAIVPGRERQLISVVIPPMDPPPNTLRLDPCTRAGVFYLFSLQLFDSLGECIWAWDGDRARLTSKRFLVFADIPFQNGAIVYSEGTDPSLEVPVQSEVLRRLSKGGRMDVEMSWPESPDSSMISQRILNSKGYRDQILSLEAENRALVQSRDALTVPHDDLRSRCDTIEGAIAQIQDQNAALRAAHNRLTTGLSECGIKEDRFEREHSTLQSRCEEVERQLSQARNQIAALTETCQRLNTGLLECWVKIERSEQQQRALHEENQLLTTEIGSLRTSVNPTLASSATLNGELQKQLRILKEELTNVSTARSTLQDQNSTLEARLRTSVDSEGQLSSRINQLEQQVNGIYQGRIWRTLVALGSPLKLVLLRRK